MAIRDQGRVDHRALLRFCAVFFALVVVASINKACRGRVPNVARDLDCDGSVSVREWYSGGLNYGWRKSSDRSIGCMEVFLLKNGLAETCFCNQPPRCRRAVKDGRRDCSP